MASVSLQTPQIRKFCWVPKAAGNFGNSPGHGNRQLNSIPVHILGAETGERRNAKVLWACEAASLVLVAKGSLRKKYRERFKGSKLGFCEGKEWRCGNTKRDLIVIAGGGQSGYERGAEGKDSGDFNGGRDDGLFVHQGYEYDRQVDGRSGGFSRGETVEDDRRPMRSTVLGYERDRGNYHTAAAAPTDVSFYEEAAAGFDRYNRGEEDITQSSAPFVRDRNGPTTYREELESTPRAPAGNAYDGGIPDKRRPYSDNRRKILGNSSLDGPPERPKSAAARAEELWQRSNQRQLDSYLSNDGIDQENSVSVSGQGVEDGVTSIEDWEVTPAEQRQFMPGAAPVDERDESQNRRYQVSRTSFDRGPERFLYKEESTGGKRNPGRQYGNANEGSMLGRGALYAKQVISQATARSVGVVAQLSVDLDSLKVVAVEVRPNLLFGKFHSIRLNSLSRIGDVILIPNEGAVLEDLDLFNCYDLVGSDLFTESGFCLGKVRDYDFRLDDGAVLSLEFDTFGVPLIPSNVISTYSLTADEVIEAQEDGLLVRNGAEKRVRKLTKGLFSRPSPSLRRRQSPSKERRKQLPQLPSPRSSSSTGAAARYVGNMGSQARVDEQGNDNDSKLTPYREPFLRERSYQENAPSQSSPYESSSQDFRPEYRSTSANDSSSIAKERSNYTSLASDGREGRMTDTQQNLSDRQTRRQSLRNSSPPTRLDNRGIPMSYRSSKGEVETSDR